MRVPRSRNLGPGAFRPGNNDLYKKMISKISVSERGSRILESKGPGLEGGGCPDHGIWVWVRPGPEISICIRK